MIIIISGREPGEVVTRNECSTMGLHLDQHFIHSLNLLLEYIWYKASSLKHLSPIKESFKHSKHRKFSLSETVDSGVNEGGAV